MAAHQVSGDTRNVKIYRDDFQLFEKHCRGSLLALAACTPQYLEGADGRSRERGASS